MPDYGHDLSFGSFITPHSQRPHDAVELAKLSERLGLDLVTFQDHPYQPAFLDTWTLLSWVAAQTERVHLSGNVINLPLRPPAMLARAAASLDLLAGGRIELALGAGAFWEGIEAMGGPRREPGEAVSALEEAIEVIREVWDTEAAGGVQVDGRYYQVAGAKRGPAPAHEIPIWLGAIKPRMLRLTGRKADGWLPSLSYIPVPDLVEDNAIIDEAAHEAGREPRQIRRLLNVQGGFEETDQGLVEHPRGGSMLQGPPERWVHELTALATNQGFSTFIFWGDDPRALQTWATEVVPVLRDAVAQERHLAS